MCSNKTHDNTVLYWLICVVISLNPLLFAFYSTFLSICKRRPSKKTSKTFWRDGKAFSKWWDTLFNFWVSHIFRLLNSPFHNSPLLGLKFIIPVWKIVCFCCILHYYIYTLLLLSFAFEQLYCVLLIYFELNVAECGSSKQWQRLWGFRATGEFLTSMRR